MRADNRNYDYSQEASSERPEYAQIASLIPPGSSVIDLGCGDGKLLQLLQERKGCRGSGIEISPSGVETAVAKGLSVVTGSIDQPLANLRDQQFDYAICNVSLQMVMYPEVLLEEMGRIARKQIVSIPNFAHFLNRFELLFGGRMPRPCLFGYEWYSTGHIHQLSLRDLEEFCSSRGFKILKMQVIGAPNSAWKQWLVSRFPNLFAVSALYLLEKDLPTSSSLTPNAP